MEVELRRGVLADRAHPAVGVRDLDAEEEVEHPGQDRVSDEPVQERHRVAVDRPLEARAHDEVVTLLEPVDERRELLERIRLVGVAHDDVLAPRLLEAGQIRAAVAAAKLGDDACPVLRGDLGRAVFRAVVDDEDLARAPRAADALERLVDDVPDGLFLVQAGDDNGDLGVGRHREKRRRP